ncbi:GOLPH3/VPS74 family protein [Nakamurella lactea]|uniref:GOLPH3/VPS74 family protein n=1 Tax=Nakamurella lactea TaxID=459515 RepID=UPI0003F75C5D|nr:GPP34 family phosphoprotein [Nakamurella lactea]
MDLLAEDMLLLLLEERSGRPLVDATQLNAALAGALVLELAMAGAIVPDGPARSGGPKISAVGGRPTDPTLAVAWDACADRPRRAGEVIKKIAGKVRQPLLERIADKGWVSKEQTKVLGVFTRTSWPEIDGRHEADLRNRLQFALLQNARPDSPHTAALISLLAACQALPKLFPDADKKSLKARAAELSEGEWAGAAVKKAIADVQAAVMVAVMVPTIVTSSGT